MRKLYLSRKDKKIFGVCGGFGQTYDLDPATVRIATVFLCLATGLIPLLITYFIAWIITPKARARLTWCEVSCPTWLKGAYSVCPWATQ